MPVASRCHPLQSYALDVYTLLIFSFSLSFSVFFSLLEEALMVQGIARSLAQPSRGCHHSHGQGEGLQRPDGWPGKPAASAAGLAACFTLLAPCLMMQSGLFETTQVHIAFQALCAIALEMLPQNAQFPAQCQYRCSS